ncbi:MAG: hypothetical protein ACXABY_34760 [Candidatus Thorarchaeota archaeon]|jgi:hypothetical protein
MTGKESHAMTAAAPYQAMIAITANIAIGITARNAAPIVKGVIPRSVLAVLMDVLHVMSRFVVTAPQHARNATRRSARTV